MNYYRVLPISQVEINPGLTIRVRFFRTWLFHLFFLCNICETMLLSWGGFEFVNMLMIKLTILCMSMYSSFFFLFRYFQQYTNVGVENEEPLNAANWTGFNFYYLNY